MIGLSVSFCVRDIVRGKDRDGKVVAIEDVEKIISGTKADSPEVWDEIIARYKKTYWVGMETQCEIVLRQLIAEDKIVQPRLTTGEAPYVGGSAWVQSESEIQWCGV